MKLYLRIWLAVVFTISILAVVVGYFWKNHTEHLHDELRGEMRDRLRAQAQESISRDLPVLDAKGNVIGYAESPIRRLSEADFADQYEASPMRRSYNITLRTGQKLELLVPGRPFSVQRFLGPSPPWYFSPTGLILLIGSLALAVALGAYPIVRRLTKRLENLQHGVEKWGTGQLSTRVKVEGRDEVAYLAQKFNTAAEQVESLLISHKSLLANASHELRSPLARIRMAVTLMQAKPDTSVKVASKAQLNEIESNIQELDSLIEEILLASRLDTPEASIGAPESFDLLGLAAEECARTHAELVVAEYAQGSFEMNGYPRLVRRLLRNLLENANRHNSHSKGTVSLLLSHDNNFLVITVMDHGSGVSGDECERIFEPFYRAKNASERDGGVGLGLALVKSIALRHGGSVVCEDTHGAGGRFIAKLSNA